MESGESALDVLSSLGESVLADRGALGDILTSFRDTADIPLDPEDPVSKQLGTSQ